MADPAEGFEMPVDFSGWCLGFVVWIVGTIWIVMRIRENRAKIPRIENPKPHEDAGPLVPLAVVAIATFFGMFFVGAAIGIAIELFQDLMLKMRR
ncbi:MAG: hypothetical protein ACRC8S_22105 [Fimbriiglobus sp.]